MLAGTTVATTGLSLALSFGGPGTTLTGQVLAVGSALGVAASLVVVAALYTILLDVPPDLALWQAGLRQWFAWLTVGFLELTGAFVVGLMGFVR